MRTSDSRVITCSKCGEKKEAGLFRFDRNENWCIDCKKAARTERRIKAVKKANEPARRRRYATNVMDSMKLTGKDY